MQKRILFLYTLNDEKINFSLYFNTIPINADRADNDCILNTSFYCWHESKQFAYSLIPYLDRIYSHNSLK